MTVKYKTLLLLPILIYLLLISVLTASAALDYKERNDLLVYADYVGCLQRNPILTCENLISSSGEYFFYLISYFLSSIFFEFSYFILIYSFMIYALVLIFVASLSSRDGFLVYFVTISFLLTDFRFYDLANNVLRHGLAVLMMLYFIYQYTRCDRSRFVYLTSALPVLSHVSSVGHFFIFLKGPFFSNGFVLSGLMAVFFLLSGLFDILLKIEVLPGYIMGKLSHYHINSKGYTDWLPTHYYLILFLSLALAIYDSTYLAVRRVFFGYVFLSILFMPMDMSYRFVSFMTPLVAIMFGYQLQYIHSMFTEKLFPRLMTFIFIMFYLIFIVMKNYDYIVKGF